MFMKHSREHEGETRPLPPSEREWAERIRYQIQTVLECGVPLHIAQMKLYGGPSRLDYERAREAGEALACQSDKLMFPRANGQNKKKQPSNRRKPVPTEDQPEYSCAELMNRLIFAVAVGAFQPGGITVFGIHFEA